MSTTEQIGRLPEVKTYTYIDSLDLLRSSAREIEDYCTDYPDEMLAVDCETFFTHGKTTRLDEGKLSKRKILPMSILLPDGTYDGSVRTIQIGMHPRIRDRQFVIDALKLPKKTIREYLGQYLEETMVLGHHFQYDWPFLFLQFGINCKHIRDTQLIAQVFGAGDYTQEFPSLMQKYRDCLDYGWFKDFMGGMDFDEYEEFKRAHQKLNWSGALNETDLKYAADDVRPIHFVYEKQVEEIQQYCDIHERGWPDDRGIANVIALECSLIPVFSMLEARGIEIDEKHHLTEVLPALAIKKNEAEAEVAKYFTQKVTKKAGRGKSRRVWEEEEPIKIRSPKMLEAIRKYVPELTSMKKEELALYTHAHPSVQLILNYKQAAQLDSFFGQKLLDTRYPDGKIHGSWNQIGTKTGRSSGNDPNMMQMPRGGGVRKSLVVPIGHIGICFDYSQIEPRIAAALYKELELLQEYITKGANADIYGITARILLGLAETPKSKKEYDRQSMKTCFLGKIYQMGPKKLADRVRSDSLGEVNWYDEETYGENYPRVISDRFDAGFPKINAAAKRAEQAVRIFAEREGTLAGFKNRRPIFIAQDTFGRIERFCLSKEQEHLPDFMLAKNYASKERKKKIINEETGELEEVKYTTNWNDFKERLSQIGRGAFNFTIQGLAASVLKLAARKIYLEFLAAGFDPITEGIIALVHDEIFAQVKEEHREQAVEIMSRCMKQAGDVLLDGAVPILVEGGWARDWAAAKVAQLVA